MRRRPIVGIVDYDAGNFASVRSTLIKIGYRTRLINTSKDFDGTDLLFLPGVGAFPHAMSALYKLDIVQGIKNWAYAGKPVIGICLGMQMLAEASHEHSYTLGLGLIPGEVTKLNEPEWHIGWNNLEAHNESQGFLNDSMGESFYFNHSYEFKAPDEYILALTRLERPIVAAVRRDNILGIQFHPEKSQEAGIKILTNSLKELLGA